MRGLLGWVHLCCVLVFLLTARAVAAFVRLFYLLFPGRPLLDALWTKSAALQRVFRYQLKLSGGAPATAATAPSTTPELLRAAGFGCETHTVLTPDGFWLVLFRVVPRGPPPRRQAPGSERHRHVAHKAPVLFVHGLMLSSDSFLATGDSALPLVLARKGHDVWLGNNRGNKYSSRHERSLPSEDAYWDYSLDELARFDVPTMVERVCSVTGRPSVAYVGFSNGTAQMFAALALLPELRQRVSAFIALSPAVAVNSIRESIVKSLVESRLHYIFLLFGRRQMLPVTLTAQRLLTPSFFARSVDTAVMFLFGWPMEHIDPAKKADIYRHIFSFSSVKQVVHWFQCIQLGDGLRMYDPLVTPSKGAHHRTPIYDVRSISGVPITAFYGTADTLVDVAGLARVLPPSAKCVPVEGLTHLELMWATEKLNQEVHPLVVGALAEV